MVTAHCKRRYITRNVSHFKVIDTEMQTDDDDAEEEDDLGSTPHSNSNAQNNDLNPSQNELRRSTRNRTRVDRFGQDVYGQ